MLCGVRVQRWGTESERVGVWNFFSSRKKKKTNAHSYVKHGRLLLLLFVVNKSVWRKPTEVQRLPWVGFQINQERKKGTIVIATERSQR